MTRHNRFSVFLCIFLFMTLLTAALPFSVLADTAPAVSIICVQEEQQISGIYWKIYRIGDCIDGNYVLTGDFSQYPVDLNDLSPENISGSANALESFVLRDGIPFLTDGTTDQDGTLTLGTLENGLYLAVPKSLWIDNTEYRAAPLIFEVKPLQEENNIYPKIYVFQNIDKNERQYLVRKIWENHSEGQIAQPVDITVDLFRDGELADSVVLNDANDWQYSWTALDSQSEWRVAEHEIPRDYTVIISYNSTQYLIKNSFSAAQTTTVSGTSTTVRTTTAAQTVTEPGLPQTGQLWWPVFPLAAVGLVMITAGICIKSGRKES